VVKHTGTAKRMVSDMSCEDCHAIDEDLQWHIRRVMNLEAQLSDQQKDRAKDNSKWIKRIADLEAQVLRVKREKTALMAELVFTHESRRSSREWQKWLDDGIAKATAGEQDV